MKACKARLAMWAAQLMLKRLDNSKRDFMLPTHTHIVSEEDYLEFRIRVYYEAAL